MGDGTVTPSPPLRRAMEITKAKLLAAVHLVIDYISHEVAKASDIIHQMWAADGGTEFRQDTDASGEPLHPHLETWLGHTSSAKPSIVSETWQNQHRRALLAQSWLERWQRTVEGAETGRPIDALIMTSTPFPAIRHDGGYPWNYGTLSPLLDITTGIFPVTAVNLEKDKVPEGWRSISAKYQEVMDYVDY